MNNAVAENTRKNWIDAAKGYGMILVILGHITEYSPVGMIIYSFHMPLFFFMSGYLFSTKRSFGEFARNKTRRLILPYFVYAIPLILWDVFAAKGRNYWQYAPVLEGTKLLSLDSYGGTYDWSAVESQETISIFLRDILGMIIQKRMWTHWFLACLIFLEILFFFLIRYINREWIRGIAVIVLATAGVVFYSQGGKPLIWNIDACFVAAAFFYVGYLIRKNDLAEKVILKKRMGHILICALALNLLFCALNIRICGYGLDMYNCDYGVIPVMYVAALAGTIAVIMMGVLFSNRYIRWVGRHSMVFFIFHQVICIPLFEDIVSRIGILQGEGIIVETIYVLAVLVMTCITLSCATFLLEKTPAKAFL